MYERYMICTDAYRATSEGFQVEIRAPYYRGIRLCLVESIEVRLDGEPVPAADITFRLRGRDYSLHELAAEHVQRWEFGERATLEVHRPALAPGEHRLSLTEELRISYMPVPLRSTAEAVLHL
ncbi:C-glycoside deglycosidase beta subunit domain-containing protein [Salinactinospora qingdaonensis]|uniref:C-deglycosylation enzyme beta subunit n=1 Tax=Salinactinospora qingdaonensis TaxID=702744 RepID=A0ABP7G4C9_9ACTN